MTGKMMLTAREAAERLGISTQRVYQLVLDGKLSASRGNVGQFLFTERAIVARAKLARQLSRATAPRKPR